MEKDIKIKGLYKRYFISAILFIISILWFTILEKRIEPKYFVYCIVDDKIPFIKEFVIAYVLWYPFLAYGLIYLPIVDKENYYRFLIYMFGGMYICYIIYMVFPNAQNLRPNITSVDPFSRLIKAIYLVDTPTNVSPSIHVFNSIAVYVGILNCKKFKNRKGLRLIALFCTIFISISTVFIKQHSFIDILWAITLAAFLYLIIYAVPNYMDQRKNLRYGHSVIKD